MVQYGEWTAGMHQNLVEGPFKIRSGPIAWWRKDLMDWDLRVNLDGAIWVGTNGKSDGEIDLIGHLVGKVKQNLWGALARTRYNYSGLDDGISERLTMAWHKRLKDGPWKHRLETVMADGIYTPWRGHQRHGRPHRCPDCAAPFLSLIHI